MQILRFAQNDRLSTERSQGKLPLREREAPGTRLGELK